MIEFINLSNKTPYLLFKNKYDEAIKNGQKNIDAMSIASYNNKRDEVDSRFVNLKFIDNENFIFFTNYNSPKAKAFESYNQISSLFYWPTINTQIRIKAYIFKTSIEYNNLYFKQRSKNKNALAISSNQSQHISSYAEVMSKFNNVKDTQDLSKCPEYWGGFSFKPFEIEFWVGNNFRLNERNMYKKNDDNSWAHLILEP